MSAATETPAATDNGTEAKVADVFPTHSEIMEALEARSEWERRQATWYQMRHDGLRRKNKPWANAADMHYPLADGIIESLKPYYTQQIFATDQVASFAALKSDYAVYQSAAAQWFDYQLKQRSNFERAVGSVAPDIMLQTAKCIVKIYWEPTAKQFAFVACNPMDIIVPSWTGPIENADWIAHVQRYSKTAYKRLAGFKNDDQTLAALCGDERDPSENTNLDTVRYTREGVTKGKSKDEIVVWEVHARDANGKWRVKTYSPARKDIELRPEFGLPYNKGVFASDMPPPVFVEFNSEEKDDGYYSPRGVCERVAAFEASLCKDWNTMKDWQTLTCNPVFSAEGGVPSNVNLRMVPGQILPFKLAAVTFPSMPVDLAQQMQGTRQTAEQLLKVPDAGTGRTVDPTKNKTAAETNLIASIMGTSTDSRSRLFRRELGKLLNLAWSVAVQYLANELDYFCMDELSQVDEKAFTGDYRVEPNGSGDNLNRGLVVQRATARFQMFKGDPDIDQKELKRSVLEADDPRIVKKLVLNEGTQQAEQLEDQAQEITIMLIGFPAQVRPTDDDASHLTSMAGFMQRRAQTGEPLTAENLQMFAMHAAQHVMALKKKNPDLYQQKGAQFQEFVSALKAQAAKLQQQQQQSKVVPGPGAGAMPGGMPGAKGAAA